MENQSARSKKILDLVLVGVLAISGVLAIIVLFSYGLPSASELRTQSIRPPPPVLTITPSPPTPLVVDQNYPVGSTFEECMAIVGDADYCAAVTPTTPPISPAP